MIVGHLSMDAEDKRQPEAEKSILDLALSHRLRAMHGQ